MRSTVLSLLAAAVLLAVSVTLMSLLIVFTPAHADKVPAQPCVTHSRMAHVHKGMTEWHVAKILGSYGRVERGNVARIDGQIYWLDTYQACGKFHRFSYLSVAYGPGPRVQFKNNFWNKD